MNTYNIYMPPDSRPDSDIASAKFLPDNKAWIAALMPPIWLLWHRLWWSLTIYVAYLAIVFLLLLTPWQHAVMFLSAIPGLYLLLEGHELVRKKLENQGWRHIGVVQANGEDDAVIRYTFSHNSPQRVSPSDKPQTTTAVLPKNFNNNSDNHDNGRNSIGIFPLESST